MNRFKAGRVPLLERSSGFNLTTHARERQRNFSDMSQLKVKSELSTISQFGSNPNIPPNFVGTRVFRGPKDDLRLSVSKDS